MEYTEYNHVLMAKATYTIHTYMMKYKPGLRLVPECILTQQRARAALQLSRQNKHMATTQQHNANTRPDYSLFQENKTSESKSCHSRWGGREGGREGGRGGVVRRQT